MADEEQQQGAGEEVEDVVGAEDQDPADDGLDLDESLDLEDWDGDEEFDDQEEVAEILGPQFVDNGDGTISDSRR